VISGIQINASGSAPGYWEEACLYLTEHDPVIGALIVKYGGNFWIPECDNPFGFLLYTLIRQQVSEETGRQLWKRFVKFCPKLDPAAVSRKHRKSLREFGLSERKIDYVYDACRFFRERELLSEVWSEASDEDVIRELLSIQGLGIWSAQMFLIFGLRRPDVCPLEDDYLVRALEKSYFKEGYFDNIPFFEKRRLLEQVSEPWRPWRTVATWYLWRSLDQGEALL
jgi:DNA-3-methyladenine glycosylase II